jgi:hypothetical protein
VGEPDERRRVLREFGAEVHDLRPTINPGTVSSVTGTSAVCRVLGTSAVGRVLGTSAVGSVTGTSAVGSVPHERDPGLASFETLVVGGGER